MIDPWKEPARSSTGTRLRKRKRATNHCECGLSILSTNRLGTMWLLCIEMLVVFTLVPGQGCFIRHISIGLSIFTSPAEADWRRWFP